MVGMRCTCLPTSTWAVLRPPDSARSVWVANEQSRCPSFARPNAAPLFSIRRIQRDSRGEQVASFIFSEESRAERSAVGFEYANEPSTSTGYQLGDKDSVVGRPPYLRRNVVASTIALAVCVCTGRAESSESPSSSSSPPSSVNENAASTTDSWYRYKGRGFVVKVPPDFEDLLEPEDASDDDPSLYGNRNKEKPFAARFGSVDRKEVLSIVVRPVSQFKLAFLEAKDITALGTLQDAAKILVPVGGRLIGARSMIAKDNKTYYLYEFTTQGKRVALVAGAAGGQLFVAGAMAPQDRTEGPPARQCIARAPNASHVSNVPLVLTAGSGIVDFTTGLGITAGSGIVDITTELGITARLGIVDIGIMATTVNNPYKLRKEEFVSNLEGTSMVEIAVLSAIVPGFMVLGQIVVSLGAGKDTNREGGRRLWGEVVRSVGIELTVAILPILACLTVLAESVRLVLATLIPVLLGCFFLLRPRLSSADEHEGQVLDQSRMSFLSAYRCAMMLVTCITILAVDFTVYPRRLAKTETYGTGLMDVGVGSFVVANALVSRQARGLPQSSKRGGALRQTSPLLILGLARLILTKGVDYQEHVGEYGVHWNFFFTLAGVTLLTSVVSIPASASGLVGSVILVVYQIWLSSGLNEYLLSSERGPDLVSLNKEGIYSTLGYWGLFLISVHLGHFIHHLPDKLVARLKSQDKGKTLEPDTARWYTALEVCGVDALLWILAAVVNEFVERVSRRTCNLAYVLFVLGMNFQVIGSFALAEAILPLRKMRWMDAFDHNLLPTFLLANVLTGLVNLSTDTISATPVWACCTLVAYLAFLAGGVTLVDAFHLRLKFW